jgi:hypothetical protein
MALTQAIGPDEAIKLLEMCDMSKHAEKLVSSKGNPDGAIPKWGEPPFDAMNKTPGQKKKKVKEDCWDGYKKVGMKKKGKKRVPNCVPTNEEIKTIKVGEDAVGSSDPHYVIVKDRKVIDQGKKEDMMKKCGKDERVWLSTKKVGDVVEKAELRHLLRLIPEGSRQDPDIKDREGTQPAAYHKGLKKTTKAKRDAHFKKHGKKADDDASAYQDAPGDKKARKGDMPKSKYTKFVDKMMDEEHEIHVRLDHLDGDARQKKAGAVMDKHEKAGHIKYAGSTDKGVIFKAKSKSHADRLHRDLKPHATGVEHTNEETQITEISKDTARSYFNKVGDKSKKEIEKRKAKGGPQRAMQRMYPDHKVSEAASPESQKAHRNMFKAAQKKKDDSAAQAEREKRLKAKGWVKNDRGGMSKVSEAAEYHVTRPGGSLKKPDSVHKSKTDAMKSAYRLSGNKHRGSRGGQVYRVHKGTVTHGFDTEGRKRHLGLDHGKVTGKKPIGEAKYAVDIEGMPRFYMDSDSPGRVKVALRQMLKKANAIKNVQRTYDPAIKADLRARLKDASTDMHTNLVGESDEVHARFMRAHGKKASGHGRWAFTTSRHSQSQPGQTFVHTGNFGDAHKKAKKHFGKPVYVMEKLKASDDMGKWVDDFKDSDAPQFKGKSMKKRRQMAIAAKLSAMREGTEAYGKSVNKMADDKKKAAMSSSDKNKLGKIADMMKKERESKVTQEEAQKKDHQTISYVTHGGQKGKVQVHKDKAFKALNHYRKNNKSAQFEETGSWKKDSGWRKAPAERKDEYGNTIKKQNIAKHLAKKAMNKTKAMGEKK